jgi:HD superfamily phosphohydrolase
MRDIKQCGCACYVYPGALHTRFEHCIGTGYLAQKLATHLTTCSDISEKDIENVTIAGLSHDLGHAAFSHLFEKLVMKKL